MLRYHGFGLQSISRGWTTNSTNNTCIQLLIDYDCSICIQTFIYVSYMYDKSEFTYSQAQRYMNVIMYVGMKNIIRMIIF